MDLEGVGPIGFQDLVAALVVSSLGPGFTAMGPGKDGGRDLVADGDVSWRGTEGQARLDWHGYSVVQVKHRARPSSRATENASWLWGEVRGELDAWASRAEGRRRVPRNLLVITNIGLSAAPGSGGHDSIRSQFDRYVAKLMDASRDIGDGAKEQRLERLARIRQIENFEVWDRSQVEALIRGNDAVRRAFGALLTPGDLIGQLSDILGRLPAHELESGLRGHARIALLGEGRIYFDEAGAGERGGVPVHEVAIDLPVIEHDTKSPDTAVRRVLARAERSLKPSVTSVSGPRHIVLTGAPGNGKTTVSKFLVHAYRSLFLEGDPQLSKEHEASIAGSKRALKAMGIHVPEFRRWPIRVDLAEYARQLSADTEFTLLKWIAELVSKRSNDGVVTPRMIREWQRSWPWVVIADGLDEVSDPAIRKRVLEHLTDFTEEAEADDLDLLMVVTTRPMGYTENIAPKQFDRVDLDYLTPETALAYGSLATRVRLGEDLDRVDRIVDRLQAAVDDEAFHNLLRTPLQVLILTIIIEAAGRLTPDRFGLFRGYFDTVYRREQAKPTGYAQLLSEHGPAILELHERVGFELQCRSEFATGGTATLSLEELHDIAYGVLLDAGYEQRGPGDRVLDQLVEASTHRLILIAPKEDGLGFDVRSLQELLAGMHLTNGPIEHVLDRLSLTAAAPQWRNTWLFAAGRLFSEPQAHHHEALIAMLKAIDGDAAWRLGAIVPVGPRLALDVIDDGMCRSRPKWEASVLDLALQTLQEAPSTDVALIARVLVRHAQTSDGGRAAIADGLRSALGGTDASREMATAVQEVMPLHFDGVTRRVRSLTAVLRSPTSSPSSANSGGVQSFIEDVATNPERVPGTDVDAVAAQFVKLAQAGVLSDDEVEELANSLEGPTSRIIESGLQYAIDEYPSLAPLIREELLPRVLRHPLATRIRELAG